MEKSAAVAWPVAAWRLDRDGVRMPGSKLGSAVMTTVPQTTRRDARRSILSGDANPAGLAGANRMRPFWLAGAFANGLEPSSRSSTPSNGPRPRDAAGPEDCVLSGVGKGCGITVWHLALSAVRGLDANHDTVSTMTTVNREVNIMTSS